MTAARRWSGWIGFSAGHLAFVTDRVDRDGDWTAAGQNLITELRANPWRLHPSSETARWDGNATP